jgi:DNA polymerase III sliding clamp (beta) subunit (PCNA family)
MKFTVSAGVLRDALARARQIIPTTPSMVAYSGVFLQAGSETLDVTASDGDSTITVNIPASVEEAGHVLLTPKPIASFIASVDASSALLIETSGGDIKVSGAGLNPYVFRPLSATFPVPSAPATGVRPERIGDLLTALQAVRSASGRDTSVVQVVSDDRQLVLHTTDGFRLARAVLPDAGFGVFTGILSLPVLERVARFGPEEVTVDVKGRQLSFRGAGVLVSSRMMGTPFPPVESVLNSAPPQVTSFDPRDMVRALARISSVAEQGTLLLEFEGTSLHLRAAAAEVGEGQETITLNTPVPAAFSLQLRAPYLADAVSSLGEEPVGVAYSGVLQPLFLSTTSPFSITHVVMPVRG